MGPFRPNPEGSRERPTEGTARVKKRVEFKMNLIDDSVWKHLGTLASSESVETGRDPLTNLSEIAARLKARETREETGLGELLKDTSDICTGFIFLFYPGLSDNLSHGPGNPTVYYPAARFTDSPRSDSLMIYAIFYEPFL